jgi:hypothetical protein
LFELLWISRFKKASLVGFTLPDFGLISIIMACSEVTFLGCFYFDVGIQDLKHVVTNTAIVGFA